MNLLPCCDHISGHRPRSGPPFLPFALCQAYGVPTGFSAGFVCNELLCWEQSQAPILSLALCLLPIAPFSPHSPFCFAPRPQSLSAIMCPTLPTSPPSTSLPMVAPARSQLLPDQSAMPSMKWYGTAQGILFIAS